MFHCDVPEIYRVHVLYCTYMYTVKYMHFFYIHSDARCTVHCTYISLSDRGLRVMQLFLTGHPHGDVPVSDEWLHVDSPAGHQANSCGIAVGIPTQIEIRINLIQTCKNISWDKFVFHQ